MITFLFSIFIPFVAGLLVSAYGDTQGWSFRKKLVISCIFGFTSGLVGNCYASEANKPFVELRKSTVRISVGTGFILKAPSGTLYLVTNWHVCNDSSWHNKMHASFPDGTSVEGNIAKSDPMIDLCAAKLTRSFEALSVASTLKPDEEVFSRGYPQGVLSESKGRYKAKINWSYDYSIEEVGSCFKGSQKLYSGSGSLSGCRAQYTDNLTTLYSRPGSSGSPVVNSEGQLVGVINSWHSTQDAGGMVTLEAVKDFLRGL